METSSPGLLRRAVTLVWGDWQANAQWQRIVKFAVAAIASAIIAIAPRVVAVFGTSTFLMLMAVVFAHPAQRMGAMVEALLMVLLGALVGLAWSLLGLYLSSLLWESNQPAAFTVRALFLAVAGLVHGFLRSYSPRLIQFLLFLLIACILVLLGGSSKVTTLVFTTVYYPLLAAGAVLLVVNVFVFPELSSSFLGTSTIDTLSETMDTIARATDWFITPGGDSDQARELALNRLREIQAAHQNKTGWLHKLLSVVPKPFWGTKAHSPATVPARQLTTLASLTSQKTKLRAQLARCISAQEEINFEISFSTLPPDILKPLSTQCMTGLVQSAVALISSCENKFITLGTPSHEPVGSSSTCHGSDSATKAEEDALPGTAAKEESPDVQESATNGKKKDAQFGKVDNVKPLKELKSVNLELIESILARIREPVQEFGSAVEEAATLVVSCLAYCYDVSKLPSGALAPTGICLEEIDIRIDAFTDALALFDDKSTLELKRATMDETGQKLDLMPRMETFLVSSFILGFRLAATHVLQMLHHCRYLVERRLQRHDRTGIWLPQLSSVREWLTTGGESDAMVLPESARKGARRGETTKGSVLADADSAVIDDPLIARTADEESRGVSDRSEKATGAREAPSKPKRRKRTWTNFTLATARACAADTLDWALASDDLAYALKFTIALFLVSWPALIASWNSWWIEARGIWAPMQLILVFEVAIGTSIVSFLIRLFGVVFGCLVGYLSYEIGQGNRVVTVIILVIGIVPSAYVQIGTKYVKAGMISVVSLAVVGIAAVTRSDTATNIFYKRLVAFLVGGFASLLVEISIYPVRARDRLVESLSASVRQVQKMQAAMSVGIDAPEKSNVRSAKIVNRFNKARNKAKVALAAAETFLPFCLGEPRLKGSFKPLEPIYREVIFVLHQIIDRMDSVVQLRRAYGSSVIEDLNIQVYQYRRNVAASCTLMLFSVNEALTTRLPLPQFIPSARVAQLRLVNRVREVVASGGSKAGLPERNDAHDDVDEQTARLITQRKFLSWNANAAGQMEIIEYLEELVDLAKLLVGVNAFRSGVLERPNYKQYVRDIKAAGMALDQMRSARGAEHDGPGASRVATEPTTDLRTVATVAQQVGRFKAMLQRRRADSGAAVEGSDGDSVGSVEPGVPMSLQRVRTRVQMGHEVARRRGFSLAGDDLGRYAAPR